MTGRLYFCRKMTEPEFKKAYHEDLGVCCFQFITRNGKIHYMKLQEENARLHSELKREKLRADFYEEMVAFGKEVYGIDLKKAGTK